MLGWCTACLVGALHAWLVHCLLGWCTACLVGAVLALASGKAERRQLHPLTVCFVGALLAWLVQLRQLHPLKVST